MTGLRFGDALEFSAHVFCCERRRRRKLAEESESRDRKTGNWPQHKKCCLAPPSPHIGPYAEKSVEQVCAFLMSTHTRLGVVGAASALGGEPGLLRRIAEYILQPRCFILTASSSAAMVWSTEGKALLHLPHDDDVLAVRLCEKTAVVISISRSGVVKRWSLFDNGELLSTFESMSPVTCADAQGSSDRLLMGSADGVCRMFSLRTQELLRTFNHGGPISAVALEPAGDLMLTGSWVALCIDFAANKMLFAEGSKACLQRCEGPSNLSLFQHPAEVLAVDMDLAHEYILTGTSDGVATLWKTSGKIIQSFRGHEDAIVSVSVDGLQGLVLTGSLDCTAKLWALDGRLLSTLQHPGPVTDVSLRCAAVAR